MPPRTHTDCPHAQSARIHTECRIYTECARTRTERRAPPHTTERAHAQSVHRAARVVQRRVAQSRRRSFEHRPLFAQKEEVTALQAPGMINYLDDSDPDLVALRLHQKQMFDELVVPHTYKDETEHFNLPGDPGSVVRRAHYDRGDGTAINYQGGAYAPRVPPVLPADHRAARKTGHLSAEPSAEEAAALVRTAQSMRDVRVRGEALKSARNGVPGSAPVASLTRVRSVAQTDALATDAYQAYRDLLASFEK